MRPTPPCPYYAAALTSTTNILLMTYLDIILSCWYLCWMNPSWGVDWWLVATTSAQRAELFWIHVILKKPRNKECNVMLGKWWGEGREFDEKGWESTFRLKRGNSWATWPRRNGCHAWALAAPLSQVLVTALQSPCAWCCSGTMAAVIKEGVLEAQKKGKLGKKNWKIVYVIVTPGGVHVFKDANVGSLW